MPTTTITQKHSQSTRPDLRSRMSPRRRLPHPSASTSSTTPQATDAQPSQLVLTYSDFLRNFDTIPVSFNGAYRHRPSYAISPFGDTYDPPEPGPSNVHSGFYPEDRKQDFVGQGGWVKDVFGRERWVGHGKIEEVDDNASQGGTSTSEGQHEDNFATPRAKTISTAFASSSKVIEEDRRSDDSLGEAIPLNSTPPPGPRSKKLPSPGESTNGSQYHSLKVTTNPTMSPPPHPNGSGSVLDDETEVSLVREILDLLTSSQEDVKYMTTLFLARSREHELSQHIDLCSRMEESLASLRASMNLRTQIGAEEWNVRSASWYQKYSRRIISLRTTLQRLSRMRELVEAHSLRPRQRDAILAKLEQHEAKLADLASKYSIAFDRLRLRHLHFLLTQSHEEAKRQKELKKSRLLSRASFERRWKEGKTLREVLRVNFNDLRQEFYNNAQRSQRHPSAPP